MRVGAPLLPLLCAACAGGLPPSSEPLPVRDAGDFTAIGIEYVLIDRPNVTREHARALAEMGLTAVKHYPDHVRWDEMQSGPRATIDFARLDDYVREYQAAGFGELALCLKPHSRWGSVDVGRWQATNASPQPRYRESFGAWVAAVVERYDGDGDGDMPGLRFPLRLLEIGSELSTYQPEPIEEYLQTLEIAHRAAKAAAPETRVTHAALLVTTAFADRPAASEESYAAAFARVDPRILHHDYAALQKLFDRPDLFDVFNFHALADPPEIEEIVRWLRFEAGRRGYDKPFVISDTFTTSFVGWGPATTCEGEPDQLAVLTPPAVEADRCRLAAYFDALIGGDEATLAWTRGFIAADTVQRALVACEQRALLVDLAFTIDLPLLTGRLARGGAGVTAWAGVVDTNFLGHVTGRRPNFHAIRQLMGHLEGARAVRRLDLDDARVRAYAVEREGRGDDDPLLVAWLDPGGVVLPGDEVPSRSVALPWPAAAARLEDVITEEGRVEPLARPAVVAAGAVRVTLTPTPVYVTRR